MIDLDERSLKRVREILERHLPACEVRLFGSRARSGAGKFSDIDLAVAGESPLPERVLSDLKDAFAESDLPYRVDVLDRHDMTPEFRTAVEEQGFVVIREAGGRRQKGDPGV